MVLATFFLLDPATDVYSIRMNRTNCTTHVFSVQTTSQNQGQAPLTRQQCPIKTLASAARHTLTISIYKQCTGTWKTLFCQRNVLGRPDAYRFDVGTTKTQTITLKLITMKLKQTERTPIQDAFNLRP